MFKCEHYCRESLKRFQRTPRISINFTAEDFFSPSEWDSIAVFRCSTFIWSRTYTYSHKHHSHSSGPLAHFFNAHKTLNIFTLSGSVMGVVPKCTKCFPIGVSFRPQEELPCKWPLGSSDVSKEAWAAQTHTRMSFKNQPSAPKLDKTPLIEKSSVTRCRVMLSSFCNSIPSLNSPNTAVKCWSAYRF